MKLQKEFSKLDSVRRAGLTEESQTEGPEEQFVFSVGILP